MALLRVAFISYCAQRFSRLSYAQSLFDSAVYMHAHVSSNVRLAPTCTAAAAIRNPSSRLKGTRSARAPSWQRECAHWRGPDSGTSCSASCRRPLAGFDSGCIYRSSPGQQMPAQTPRHPFHPQQGLYPCSSLDGSSCMKDACGPPLRRYCACAAPAARVLRRCKRAT